MEVSELTLAGVSAIGGSNQHICLVQQTEVCVGAWCRWLYSGILALGYLRAGQEFGVGRVEEGSGERETKMKS